MLANGEIEFIVPSSSTAKDKYTTYTYKSSCLKKFLEVSKQ